MHWKTEAPILSLVYEYSQAVCCILLKLENYYRKLTIYPDIIRKGNIKKLTKSIPTHLNLIEPLQHLLPSISNMNYGLVFLTMYDSPAFVLKTVVLLSTLFNSIFLLPGPYTE